MEWNPDSIWGSAFNNYDLKNTMEIEANTELGNEKNIYQYIPNYNPPIPPGFVPHNPKGVPLYSIGYKG